MALFRQLKRAFGFSDAEMEEEELEGIDARVTPLRRRNEDYARGAAGEHANILQSGTEMTNAAVATTADASCGHGDDNSADRPDDRQSRTAPSDIFESVVKVFNESLPEFIKQSVDEKAQREYLYSKLDQSMQRYVEGLERDVNDRCSVRWEAERKALLEQMDELRLKSQKTGEESNESKKLQLSAERQKRALSERVHELEKQLASLEAENEQYLLENKSLMNKLRLNSVMTQSEDGDVREELSGKILELTEALGNERNKVAVLEKDNGMLKDALEQSKVKDNLGDAMLSDLNARLAEAKEQADKHKALAEDLANEKNLLDDSLKDIQRKFDELSKAYEILKTEKSVVDDRLAEATENLSVVEKMHEQLSALEAARRSNESFLRKQKDELLQKDETIQHLKTENSEYAGTLRRKEEIISTLEETADSLRKTIETNLYENAQTVSAMRSEIERLRHADRDAVASVDEMPAYGHIETGEPDDAKGKSHKGRGQRTSRPRISAIDETIEDTDWLIATPPVKKKEQKVEQPEDFGYREPTRKNTPDNPAQMSLW